MQVFKLNMKMKVYDNSLDQTVFGSPSFASDITSPLIPNSFQPKICCTYSVLTRKIGKVTFKTKLGKLKSFMLFHAPLGA